MTKEIKVAPSIICADFSVLKEELERLEKAGVDALHIDIMDGHFVPNLTLGPSIVCSIKRHCNLFLDVHLMMYNPYDYIERFVKSGAQSITFHLEATEDIKDTLAFIKTCNVEAGLALNPSTPVSLVEKYLPQLDRLLIMSVEPGFSGQQFLESSIAKVQQARELMAQFQLDKNIEIQVDGGVDSKQAPKLIQAGATSLVSGSFLFQHPDMSEGVLALKKG